MENLEKMINAKKLIMEVEQECIDNVGYSPYEIGYALRSLEGAIELVEKLQTKKKESIYD